MNKDYEPVWGLTDAQGRYVREWQEKNKAKFDHLVVEGMIKAFHAINCGDVK
jgi:hypothetical protein